jgi:glycerol-3-phosphate cytidylyltransferase
MTYFESSLPTKPYPIGYASGYFDLFHIGHLRYLQLAAQHCEKLVVGIPADQVVRAAHRLPPFTPCEQRIAIVAALRCVSEVVCVATSMDQPDAYLEFLRDLSTQAVFIGGDWQGSARWTRLGPKLHAQGLKIHFLPRTEAISSSLIRQRQAAVDSGTENVRNE